MARNSQPDNVMNMKKERNFLQISGKRKVVDGQSYTHPPLPKLPSEVMF